MTFWGIIGAGWRGAFGAMAANAALYAAVTALIVGFNLGVNLLFPLHHVQKTLANGSTIMVPDILASMLRIRTLILGIIANVIVSPLMIGVHRHILLAEDRHVLNNKTRLLAFAGMLVAMHLSLFEIPALVVQATSPLLGIGMFVSYWLLGRLALTYPAIALDMPRPLLTSWRLTKGHWWFVVAVMVFGMLPVFLPVVPTTIAVMHSTPETVEANYTVQVIVGAIFGAFYPAIAAALASELYRKFGGLAQGA